MLRIKSTVFFAVCVYVNVKSFPSYNAHKAALISHFVSPQPDTGLHCQTTDTGLVHRAVCLFTRRSFAGILIAPTHGEMARLSCPGRLFAYRDGFPACRRPVAHPSTNRARRRSTSLMRPTALTLANSDEIIDGGVRNLEDLE